MAIFLTVSFSVFAKPSISEFREDIIRHRRMVTLLVLNIVENYPQHFPELHKMTPGYRRYFLKELAYLHDLEKLDDDFIEKLYKDWGIAMNERRPKYITAMNEREAQNKNNLLSHKFSHIPIEILRVLIDEFKFAERIGDVLDTKINRGPEMGADFKPFEAEQHIRQYDRRMLGEEGAEIGAQIAHDLEVKVYKHHELVFCEAQFRSSN